jgi:D-alanine-D-alanine ligase
MQRYEHVGVTIVNDAADLEAVTAMRPDLVFIGVKRLPHTVGSSTTKVWVNDYLDGQDINYTGSPASAIALDLNKPIAKRVVAAANLPTAEFFTASVGQYSSAKALPLDFPLFVKPPDEGGGKGISSHSVVRDFADFQRQLLAITARFQTDALVERYLTGREFSVAILDAVDSNAPMAMPVELVTERNAQGDRILGKDVKNADTEQVLAVEDEGIRRAVSGLALDVFKALGGRDYGRIDIRMDERGVPHFLEANLLPGLSGYDSEGGYFTRACQMNMAMDYQTMILRIVELALARGSHSDLNVTIPIITMLPTLDAVF